MINSFSGEYAFLSNFWVEPVEYMGLKFRSVEHAFQALKADTLTEFLWVASAPTPGEAKKRGRAVTMREDWNSRKVEIMHRLLKSKFDAGTDLGNRLEATGEEELVEGNTWGDRWWGVCQGVGQNHLGNLLMQVRNAGRNPE